MCASGARLRSSQHRKTTHIGSAGTTARTPLTLIGPRVTLIRPLGCRLGPPKAVRWPRRHLVHPTVDGAALGPRPTSPDPTDSCWGEGGGAAPVSRRDLTTEAVGGGVACPRAGTNLPRATTTALGTWSTPPKSISGARGGAAPSRDRLPLPQRLHPRLHPRAPASDALQPDRQR